MRKLTAQTAADWGRSAKYNVMNIEPSPSTEPVWSEPAQRNTEWVAPLAYFAHVRSDLDHIVQFYEDDTYLVQSLMGFIVDETGVADCTILIATQEHLRSVADAMACLGYDLPELIAKRRFVVLDAGDSLNKISLNGPVDKDSFFKLIKDVFPNETLPKPETRVFGEMVALLVEDGRTTEALLLESWWQELIEESSFRLLCAYNMSSFTHPEAARQFAEICEMHARVLPSEGYPVLGSDDERSRAIAELQKKA